MIETVRWRDGVVRLLDQTRLPEREIYLELEAVDQVVEAIRALRVRGAPAIGIAAAYGMVLGAWRERADERRAVAAAEGAAAALQKARPTAVNLFWALDRMRRALRTPGGAGATVGHLLAEADRILEEDLQMSRRMGGHGASLLHENARVLTHCNAGALATGGLGTALAVVYEAHARGMRPEVYADETRPLLQGARLTAWELKRAGIPVTLICDGAAAWALKQRRIDAVFIGADRIAANGDVANKIGSYGVALAAREAGVPFYVVAPTSSIDRACPSGGEIPIEERGGAEVRAFAGRAAAPDAVAVFNPAFDVTPARLVTGIITEHGVHRPPYRGLA